MKNELSIISNKWRKVYWFARMLINTDKYGGIGKENKLLLELASSLRVIIQENKTSSEKELMNLLKKTLNNLLLDRFKNAK